jgi:TolB-like protein/DNA-binding winged helix-turn-helix (wHTH) protein
MESRTSKASPLRFGVFELDIDSGELRRHGLKVRLPDQSFQILKLVLGRAGEVVTRDELRHALWTADTFVDFEVGLNSAVRKLREALDDSADNPRFVETVPRRGYRFIASVTTLDAALLAPREPSAGENASSMQPAADDRAPTPPLHVASSHRRTLGWRNAAMLCLAIVSVTAFLYLRARPAQAGIRSLVVLPFENLSGDQGQDYFADSVTDAVTAHLSQAGLDVISRTSARQYKQTTKRLPEIARELGGVQGIVEGTLRKSGDRVQITVKLIRAATDRSSWSRTYDDDVRQMLALQRRIASDVAVAAGRPGLPAARTQTIDPQAYEAYIKGMTAQGQQRFEGFQRAVAYYDEAIRIQPDFAEAHAALAVAQLQFLQGGPLSPHQIVPKGEAAARRAIQLDETVARAHMTLGQFLILYHWRMDEGYKELLRAAELQADGPGQMPSALSAALRRQGRFEDAVVAAERARKLDPLSTSAQIAVGTAYRAAGQYDRSIQELRRALAMSPTLPRTHFQLGVTLMAMGRYAEAIPEIAIAARPATGHNTRVEGYLGYAYAAAGRTNDARAVLNELEAHRREQYVSWFGTALIHDVLGERQPALMALRRAYDDHAVEFAMNDLYPPFKTIAAEPEYLSIMRQVGL